ncbi:MAG: hypothetical protein JW822_09385 [Spirochaetales bacterium]|nr:hypothetical protein [Spirochaetales bacterium]
MKNELLKTTVRVLLIGLLFVFLFGCALPGSDNDSKSAGSAANEVVPQSRAIGDSLKGPGSIFEYDYGLKGALRSNQSWDDTLAYEYSRWKSEYVTSSGAGGHLRVKRDAPSMYDTVSEGIAYGMLLAMYFNDHETFIELYRYALDHLVRSDIHLMHWKVDSWGMDISEYYIEVPHTTVYLDTETIWNKTKVPPNDRIQDEDRTYIAYRTNPDPDRFFRASSGRQKSSAADADFDMAAALIMAYYKWGDQFFMLEAAKMLKSIVDHDLNPDAYNLIKNGTSWGDIDCWNPSYFMPAWFRLYVKFIEEVKDDILIRDILRNPDDVVGKINQSLEITMQQMEKIKNNSSYKLFPDWCGTAGGQMVRAEGSDRRYFLDENEDGIIDDQNGDGSITEDDYVSMMSYNFYYDAVRVPWRLALDYSWYGYSRSYNLIEPMRSFFYSKNKGLDIKDGYRMSGYSWRRDYRDGFNNITRDCNGGQGPSTTFYAMCATAFMINARGQSSLDRITQKVLNTDDYGQTFNYYGNTLRLLSLLYLSGRFTNPCVKVALKAQGNGKYVCADAAIDNALYANRSAIGLWETFDFVNGAGGQVWIRSYMNNKYVVNGWERLVPTGSDPGWGWGGWDLINLGGNVYALYGLVDSNTRRYTCADYHADQTNWRLTTSRTEIGPWEKFEIIKVR